MSIVEPVEEVTTSSSVTSTAASASTNSTTAVATTPTRIPVYTSTESEQELASPNTHEIEDDDDEYEECIEINRTQTQAYFKTKMYKTELEIAPLEKWDTEKVALFTNSLHRYVPKKALQYRTIADFMRAKNLNGSLLCAIDRKYLFDEITAARLLNKKEGGKRLQIALQFLFEALEAQKEGSNFDSYWPKLLAEGGDEGAAIAKQYVVQIVSRRRMRCLWISKLCVARYSNSPLLPHLIELLRPVRRSQVKFEFHTLLLYVVIPQYVFDSDVNDVTGTYTWTLLQM